MDRRCSKRVILTRSAEYVEKDRRIFEEKGYKVVALPLIETRPLEFSPPKDIPDIVVFQSAKAVHFFLERFSLKENTKVVAVGEKTKKALEERGYRVDVVPEDQSAEGIVKALGLGNGEVVLIPRSRQGRTEAIEGLKAKGYKVYPLDVYETKRVSYEATHLERLLRGGGFIVFASPSAVKSLFENLQKDRFLLALKDLFVVAIGKTTKKELEKLGVSEVYTPTKPLMEAVVGKIHELWQKNCTS